MRILLINPPNCGRSIPEERYGIDSLRSILRSEPLALETLAGNLDGHEVAIVDLKAAPEALDEALASFAPELAGITAMTCEAQTALALARRVKSATGAIVAVGGVHASADPEFFNRPEVDYVAVGLGKASFRELADALAAGEPDRPVPGVGRTRSGGGLQFQARAFSSKDLVEEKPPRFDLTATYRDTYRLPSLGVTLGCVATAAGCPHRCAFCSIGPLTGGRYFPHAPETVVRDLKLLPPATLTRLVDANSFADPAAALALCRALRDAGLSRPFVADARADTVVRHPELFREWKAAGLKSVVIGFEEIRDEALADWSKGSKAAANAEAVEILHGLGIGIIGDFIASPEYGEADFDALLAYIVERKIDLPMVTVLTPLPGTPLFARMKDRIVIDDLDYYTMTNAVVPTRLPEETFYRRYSDLLRACHKKPSL